MRVTELDLSPVALASPEAAGIYEASGRSGRALQLTDDAD